jgi:hypothetical protein
MRRINQKLAFWRTPLLVTALVVGAIAPMLASPAKAQAAPTLPAYRYTKTFDASASGAFAEASGVATDASGDVYIVGQFQGTVVFDGAGGSDSQTSTNTDAFLTKYNANGSYAYTKIFDVSASNAFAQANGVAVDSNGNVYVAGAFFDTVVFDGPGGSDSQTSSNGSGFLTKYTASGAYVSTKVQDTSASGAFAENVAVTTDTGGNVYVTGDFGGTVTFDGTGGSDNATSGSGSSFLTQYNSAGSYGYTKTFDTDTGGGNAFGQAVTADNSGNIYITGSFNGSVIFDGPGGSDSQTSGSPDSFVTKYQANGSYVYTKIFDVSGGRAHGQAITTDASGNVYVGGIFRDSVIFDGPGGSDTKNNPTNNDGFLTKYDSTGSYVYTKIFDSTAAGSNAQNTGIVVAADGNVYVASRFFGTVVFDGPGGSNSLTSNNGSGALTQYDSNGNYQYTKINDSDSDPSAASNAYGLAADTRGNVFLAGDFEGQVTFDGPGGNDTQNGGPIDSAFLTSYQTFVPAASPGSSASLPAALVAPKAPNTGFGAPPQLNPLRIISLASSVSLILLVAAAAERKRSH